MAVSDQLSKLAARAKEAEEHAAAAQDQTKVDLERDVETARASAQAHSEKLRETVDASKGKISDRWSHVQGNWNEHLAAARENIDSKKAEHDVAKAQKNAERAEQDAEFAIDFAYSALEEAEAAVLEAVLERTEADELSAEAGTSA